VLSELEQISALPKILILISADNEAPEREIFPLDGALVFSSMPLRGSKFALFSELSTARLKFVFPAERTIFSIEFIWQLLAVVQSQAPESDKPKHQLEPVEKESVMSELFLTASLLA